MSEIIYGIHTIQTLLNHKPNCFLEVFISRENRNKRLFSLIQTIQSYGIIIRLISRRCLDKKSGYAIHQGIVAYVELDSSYQESDLLRLISKFKDPFLLILDGITDSHNLGACLRSASAAGVHAVITPKKRSAKLNAIARKVACGAAEDVPLIRVTNLVRTMRILQKENIWIIGTSEKANHTLYQGKMTGPITLVMGAEGKGMRNLTKKHCDELINIPIKGNVTSLNVSVATGICLFEAVRQRSHLS